MDTVLDGLPRLLGGFVYPLGAKLHGLRAVLGPALPSPDAEKERAQEERRAKQGAERAAKERELVLPVQGFFHRNRSRGRWKLGTGRLFLSFALLLSAATTVEVKDPSLGLFLSTNN